MHTLIKFAHKLRVDRHWRIEGEAILMLIKLANDRMVDGKLLELGEHIGRMYDALNELVCDRESWTDLLGFEPLSEDHHLTIKRAADTLTEVENQAIEAILGLAE